MVAVSAAGEMCFTDRHCCAPADDSARWGASSARYGFTAPASMTWPLDKACILWVAILNGLARSGGDAQRWDAAVVT
jgi:hypothetical protein